MTLQNSLREIPPYKPLTMFALRASPTGGESVGTVSSECCREKGDAEGTHETNSRATPMDIESQPGSEQGREVEGFQYEASTEGGRLSPVLETKASSVDRHASSPTPDPPMFGPGLMGISEMVAGYFQREQEERMNRIEDEIERPQGIERGPTHPDVVTWEVEASIRRISEMACLFLS